MTIYAVDIRDRNGQAVTDEFEVPADERMRFYKVEADSFPEAFNLAIALAKTKLDSWNRTLDEYYKPSLGLPQDTGTISLLVSRIDTLRSYIGEHDETI